MPKKSDKPLESIHLKLYAGDRETLQEFYPAPVGYNAAVRRIVNLHCNKLRERASRKGVSSNVGALDLEDELAGLTSSLGGDDTGR